MKPRVWLVHGFNDGSSGHNNIDRLAFAFHAAGFEVVHDQGDYGWVGPLFLRHANASTVDRMLPLIRPGDIFVGHSNAAYIGRDLVRAGAPFAALVLVQPALDRATEWPEGLAVLCLHNPNDWIVRYAATTWAWLASKVRFWAEDHGWGSAGYHGFDQGSENWDTSEGPEPALGHSGIFQTGPLLYWGERIVRWVLKQLLRRAEKRAYRAKAVPA